MFEEKRNTVLLHLCVVCVFFTPRSLGRSLIDQEKTRLHDGMKRRSNTPYTIDISFTKKVLTRLEAAKRKRKAMVERTKKLREETKSDSITLGSFDIALADGSDIRLSETRNRIGTGLRMRIDTTIFANIEKTETSSETTKINTGYAKDSPRYEIDHKLKRCSTWIGLRWSGREVLRFGKVDEPIVIDIVRFCTRAKARRKKNFLHSGTATVDGKVVDEIECIDLENGKPAYRISLDSDDWHICRKIVWYDDKSGLVSKIVEYKEFAKAKGSGELFPRLVISRYFNDKGKEEKVETINVNNVVLGHQVSDDIFRLDVPNGYTELNYSSQRKTQPR